MKFYTTHCCALDEIDNLGLVRTAEEAVRNVANHYWPHARHGLGEPPSMLLFTGVTQRVRQDHTLSARTDDYGQAFADFIEENGLGTVSASDGVRNPKTGNTVKAWTWCVNWAKVYEVSGLGA